MSACAQGAQALACPCPTAPVGGRTGEPGRRRAEVSPRPHSPIDGLPAPRLRFQGILKPTSSPRESVADAELTLADFVGRLMRFWGFKRPMGRLWTILYLSPEPLGAAELAERLKMSAGGVSMALAELCKWGAVTKSWRPGERRDFFQAEQDIWKMVRRVLAERELTLVREFAECLEEASERVAPAEGPPPEASGGEMDSDLSYKRERLEHLLALARTGETLLSALVSGQSVDPSRIINRSAP